MCYVKLPYLTLYPVQEHTEQIISIKRDFPDVNIVIGGGHGAPLVSVSHPGHKDSWLI
jgi:hypothetical protein